MSFDLALFIPMLMGRWMADDASRHFASDVRSAIDAVMPRKEAAGYMDITEQQLSEWLACVRPMNAFRLTALPEAFWHELLSRQAARRGGYYFGPDVVTLLRGAAMLRKPMAKMAARAAERKQA